MGGILAQAHIWLIGFVFILVGRWSSCSVLAAHRVPEGFVLQRVAGAPLIKFPMFACFDDDGRLFVAESSGLDLYEGLQKQTRLCRISRLEDRDGDGEFDHASIFADRLVFPMGLAWRDGRLYVADPPDLVAFDDTNDDGVADRRTVLLGTFGHTDNGSLHGLTFGPDGLLYMTMGSPDGYRLKQADGTVIEGRNGALIRCQPDGSMPEVLCRGFENLVEVVFLSRGEIIGTDNWFTLPAGGIRDALVHLEPGGRYPLDQHEPSAPLPFAGKLLPAITHLPAVAVSGLVLYRGDSFPVAMKGNVFSAQHNTRKVARHRLVESGSTFRTEDFDFLVSDDPDFHPSDVLESADGSLIIIDTGGWYVQHCPTGKIRNSQSPGGIYRVRHAVPARLDDPWGSRIDWAQLGVRELGSLLSDSRFVVRDRAQRMLVTKGASALQTLAEILEGSATVAAKQHAVWALAAMRGDAPRRIIERMLRQSDNHLVTLAARALSFSGDSISARHLEPLLAADSPSVRLAAAQALAVCGDTNTPPHLVSVLSRDPDAFEEHALAYALDRTASQSQLRDSLNSPSAKVRKIAMLLLDRPPHLALPVEAVLQSLSSADFDLRSTALRLLQRHPDWAASAASVLREWLSQRALSPEAQEGIRSLVLAFQSEPAIQNIIATFLDGPQPDQRLDRSRLLLEIMAQASPASPPQSWVAAISQMLREDSLELRREAVKTAARLSTRHFDQQLTALATEPNEPADLRLDALGAIVPNMSGLPAEMFEFLLMHFGDAKSPARRLVTGQILGRARLNDDQQRRLIVLANRQSLVSPSVLMPAFRQRQERQTDELLLTYLKIALEQNGWRPAQDEAQNWVKTFHTELQPKAQLLFADSTRGTTALLERLSDLEPLLHDGDEVRGRAIFFGERAACSICHRVAEQGGIVGPDLTKIGAIRSGRDLIESIVVPGSTMAQGYEPYTILLADGQELDGILARRDADLIVLRDSAGGERRIRASQIKEMRRRTTSLMPEGLDRALAPEELRDLLAFLQSLK